MGEAWIIDAVRTPRGRGKKDGALAGIHPQELMAQVLNAIKDRNNLNPLDVEDVLVGCVTAYGEQAMCIARMSVLAAEWESPRSSNGFDVHMRRPPCRAEDTRGCRKRLSSTRTIDGFLADPHCAILHFSNAGRKVLGWARVRSA